VTSSPHQGSKREKTDIRVVADVTIPTSTRGHQLTSIVRHDDRFALAVYDVRAGRHRWSVPLDGLGLTIDVTGDERRAVVDGPNGIEIVDLERRSVRQLSGMEMNHHHATRAGGRRSRAG
jgi:hypothetical protein